MAKSKIEKPQPDTDFKLLYTNVVTMINDNTNTAFNVIPDEDKKKFLNFYNLSDNEQLELISDLLKIKDLPKEMTAAINQFPYFHTIHKPKKSSRASIQNYEPYLIQ